MSADLLHNRALRLLASDYYDALKKFEERWGDDRSDCGGWKLSGPPCGGCYACGSLRVFYGLRGFDHYFRRARAEAA